MESSLTTAIIPSYNEDKTLPQTIKRLQNVVDEILVIDNGSTDNTLKIMKKMGVTVINEPRKQNGIGYGFAHMTGLKNAKGKYIVAVDADGEHPIEDIPKMVEYAKMNKIDVLIGSRKTTESSKLMSRIRRFGNSLLSLEVRILFGYPLTDVLSGMYVMNRKVINKLDLSEGDWNFSPEYKLKAITHPKVNVDQFPITATVRKAGKSKQILWKTALVHAFYILNFRVEIAVRPVYNQVKLAILRLAFS